MEARTDTMLSIPAEVVILAMQKRTLQLETTTSFAAIPEIRATAICQYPSPAGASKGTRAFPMIAPKLSEISDTKPCGPRFMTPHIIMEAMKMTVPAISESFGRSEEHTSELQSRFDL